MTRRPRRRQGARTSRRAPPPHCRSTAINDSNSTFDFGTPTHYRRAYRRRSRTRARPRARGLYLVPITGTPSSFGPPHNTPTIPAPSIPTGAPVLAVNACWATPILMGLKTWEIRTQNALKRGTIYIAISGLSEIWGEVTLMDSHKPSASEWEQSSLKHIIAHRSDPPPSHPPFGTQRWAWHLTNARLYDSPIPASRPKGPVVWTAFTPANPLSNPDMGNSRPTHEPQPPPPTPLTDEGARRAGTAPHVLSSSFRRATRPQKAAGKKACSRARAIGAVTPARRAVVYITHFHRGKKPCRVPRVCRLVVSRLLFSRRSAERALVQRAARRVAPARRGRRRVWVERSGGSHRRS